MAPILVVLLKGLSQGHMQDTLLLLLTKQLNLTVLLPCMPLKSAK